MRPLAQFVLVVAACLLAATTAAAEGEIFTGKRLN
jgi:hypothetical protein